MAGPAATHEYMLYLPSTRHLSNLSDLKWRFGLLWPKCPAIRFLPWLFGFKYIMETYCYVKSLAFRSLLLLLVFEIKHVELVLCIIFLSRFFGVRKYPALCFFASLFRLWKSHTTSESPALGFLLRLLDRKNIIETYFYAIFSALRFLLRLSVVKYFVETVL